MGHLRASLTFYDMIYSHVRKIRLSDAGKGVAALSGCRLGLAALPPLVSGADPARPFVFAPSKARAGWRGVDAD